MLFDPNIPLRNESKLYYESSFKFLERSSWNRSILMKSMLSNWIVPMLDDHEFLSQIKSENDKNHYAAIFELIVFVLLRNLDFKVNKHPVLKKKTTPDFEAINKSKHKIILECTLSGNSFETLDVEKRKAAVVAIIRDIHYYPYFINISFKEVSKTSISKKSLLNFIDTVKDASIGYPNETLFNRKHPFVNNGWKLEISLTLKTDPNIKVSLGAISHGAKIINGTKAILTALNDKRPSKYGIVDVPYVICLCNNDIFLNLEEMHEVLFGTNSEGFINTSSAGKSGFFLHNNSPINTSVSAIILFKNTDIFTLDSSKWSIWHNPFAKKPLDKDQLPLDEYYYEMNQQVLEKKVLIKNYNIFNLLSIDEKLYINDPKGSQK